VFIGNFGILCDMTGFFTCAALLCRNPQISDINTVKHDTLAVKRPHWSLFGALTHVAKWNVSKSTLALLEVIWQWKCGLGSLAFFWHFLLSLEVNFQASDYLQSENCLSVWWFL